MSSNITVPTPEVARYDAPTVDVVPVTEVISSAPVDGRSKPGHYQHVLLDVQTGRLLFHEGAAHLTPWDPTWKSTNDVPRELWNSWHPGNLWTGVGPHAWCDSVPELICWVIDSGGDWWPYLGVEEANALLDGLRPYAQALLDGLFEALGELDWSADSAHAGRQIERLTNRDRMAAADREVLDADLVDYGDIVAQYPQVYRADWLGKSPADLAHDSQFMTRYIASWHPEITKTFGRKAFDTVERKEFVVLDVTGVRAWYRTVLAGDDPRPFLDWLEWDSQRAALVSEGITAETSDTDVQRFASYQEQVAGRELGVRLTGAQQAAHAHRNTLRNQEWDRLALDGAEVARLELRLSQARQARQARVRKVIGWDAGHGDALIATQARMTRQAVYKIRNKEEVTDVPVDQADELNEDAELAELTGECPGCVGRGTSAVCCMCGKPIPVELRRDPDDADEYREGCAQCQDNVIHTHQL